MIELRELTKRYGEKLAVDRLTFDILPGRVTGFLGPNGAGKSTTIRLILGLDAPAAGSATVNPATALVLGWTLKLHVRPLRPATAPLTRSLGPAGQAAIGDKCRCSINGRHYRSMRRPLHEVGSLLESAAIHPGRSARGHLLALAAASGIGRRRVDEVLEITGLAGVTGQRAGRFSLGMTQRLGVAAALLGDPAVLLLDEPVNGLDPDGVAWIRGLLRALAAEGRTVFLSSHLMSEMENTADHLIVIGRGKLIADQPLAEFTRGAGAAHVQVRSPCQDQLARLLREAGAVIGTGPDGSLNITGATAADVGKLAARHAIELHELVTRKASLEEAFMKLTRDAVEYRPCQDVAP